MKTLLLFIALLFNSNFIEPPPPPPPVNMFDLPHFGEGEAQLQLWRAERKHACNAWQLYLNNRARCGGLI